MQKVLKSELNKLKFFSHTDKKIINKALKRINNNRKLVKSENIKSHFCSFFVPIHKKSKSVYLVHHIKAQDWIPPGGHIEKNEHPVDTVKREFIEELNYQLSTEPIKLFNITVNNVKNNRKHPCWFHYDFWYLVYIDRLPFKFNKNEFYNADWFSIEDALNKIKTAIFRDAIKKISDI